MSRGGGGGGEGGGSDKIRGYNINVSQQTACLVVNPIMVGNFAFLFNCTPMGQTSDSMREGGAIKYEAITLMYYSRLHAWW